MREDLLIEKKQILSGSFPLTVLLKGTYCISKGHLVSERHFILISITEMGFLNYCYF
jgi:hypothetical protein